MLDFSLYAELGAGAVAAAFACFLVGGLMKGAFGFGLPLVAISLTTAFLPVELALALNAVPPIVLNVWQALHGRLFVATVKRFWPVVAGMAAGTFAGAFVVSLLDDRALMGALGGIVIAFCAISAFTPRFRLAPGAEHVAGWLTGLAAGVVGAASTVNGPVFIMYLIALRAERTVFVAALGLFFFFSGLFISAAFAGIGLLDAPTLLLALGCVPPAALGMYVGQRLSRRIHPERFHKLVLALLLVLGANLVRRALLGS